MDRVHARATVTRQCMAMSTPFSPQTSTLAASPVSAGLSMRAGML